MSKLIGDGLTMATAYRPAWREILTPPVEVTGQCIESERYMFWLGQIDTDVDEHSAMMASSDIRHVPQAILGTAYDDLTAPQQTAVIEIITWLGFPTNIWRTENARIADILFYIMGRAAWHPVQQAADA